MRYFTYDEAGAITGAYMQELHPTHEAGNWIEVTEQQYAQRHELQVVDGELQAKPAPDAAQLLASAIHAFVQQVDREADAIRKAVIGERATEYATALQHAQSYAAADYTGPVPAYVASWTAAKAAAGWTDQQAADDIIATGAAWLAAEEAIRAQRLLRKEQARLAPDLAALATVRGAWVAFVAAIRAQLGG